MTNSDTIITPTIAPPQPGPRFAIPVAITALTSLGGYLWAGCQDGSLYRIRPNPLDVLQVLPSPATRDAGLDQTFEFQQAMNFLD